MRSSRIEGTRASLTYVLPDEMGNDTAKVDATNVRELRNHINTPESGVERLESLPLSL
ncbi:MAG: hypothetical protein ACYDHM_15050 [Acidiferrobacterales bacterium]